MAVEVRGNVVYRWNTIRENELASIQSWTDAARKIREVRDDTYRIAVATAPVGESGRLKRSHSRGAPGFAGRFRYRVAVWNDAPHALWVHEGTLQHTGMPVYGNWMGPVPLGGGYRGVSIPRGKRWANSGSSGRTGRFAAYFNHFTFRGQKSQPWLDNAGTVAYHMPGNS